MEWFINMAVQEMVSKSLATDSLEGAVKVMINFAMEHGDVVICFSEAEVKAEFCCFGILGMLAECHKRKQYDVDKLSKQIADIIRTQMN